MDNRSPLISIIVPIYKVECFLSKCLDSILSQTYSNIEILLIDDGSPDRSGQICDEYAKMDKRIKVIHQQNQGVVSARNTGIALSAGEYLAFVDPDDYLSYEMYKNMMDIALIDEADIIWCDVNIIKGQSSKIYQINFDNDCNQMINRLLSGKVRGYIWNKLIKKSFFQHCNIHLDKKCVILEDTYMSLQLLCNHPKMSYVSLPLYNYVLHTSSASNKPEMTHNVYFFDSCLPNIQYMHEYLKENGYWRMYKHICCIKAMEIKMVYLREGHNYKKAKAIFPYAHTNIDYYSMGKGLSLLYWFGFNAGIIGEYLLKLYLKIKL